MKCDPGWGDCDGDLTNGCETDVFESEEHCGACGTTCSGFTNATASCSNGVCKLGACSPGFGNCNSDVTDGCETSTDGSTEHCGACGEKCDPGKVCQAGACVGILQASVTELAADIAPVDPTGSLPPCDLTADSNALYYVRATGQLGQNDFVRLPKDGGNASVLHTGSGFAVTVDGSDLYISGSLLQRIPTAGGAVVSLGASTPRCIALDATDVYWVAGNSSSGTLKRLPKTGGPAVDVASLGSGSQFCVAVDETHVYWTKTFMGETAFRISKQGGTPTTLTDLTYSGCVALTATSALTIDVFMLSSFAKTDGSKTWALNHDPSSYGSTSAGLAVDATHVYFPARKAELWRVPLGGGTPEVLVTGQGEIGAVLVDATHVYWRDIAKGSIARATK
jgi:hypothetical protein